MSGSGVRSTVVAEAMRRFVATAVVALVLVGVASVLVARAISRDLAVRDSVVRGSTFALGVSGPLVDEQTWKTDPAALASFSTLMQNRLREGSMRHIKVWNSEGRILWSDERVVVGQRFDLEPRVRRLFRTGGAVGTLSALDKDENVLERDEGPLLEVYAATPSATGERVIVESYWSTERIDDDAREVMARTAPLALGALVVFALLILPLARSLARRVERARDENTALLRQSLAASDLERVRIARDLHDGVMQDISGAGYALSAALGSMSAEPERPRQLVEEVVGLLHGVGESMRSTLADTYPTDLAGDGLRVAVQHLADRMSRSGVEVEVDVSALDNAQLEVVQLCFRVVREGLRNVERHAHAQHARVEAQDRGETVQVSVEDDGVGLGSGTVQEGHFGLTLLRDTVTEVGGTMTVGSGRLGGASLAVTLPKELSGPG